MFPVPRSLPAAIARLRWGQPLPSCAHGELPRCIANVEKSQLGLIAHHSSGRWQRTGVSFQRQCPCAAWLCAFTGNLNNSLSHAVVKRRGKGEGFDARDAVH